MFSNKFVLVALAMVSVAAVCAYSQEAGGLGKVLPANEQVRGMITALQPEIERQSDKSYKQLEPITYRRQVVAGLNYFVKVMAVDEEGETSYLHVRIYQPFSGPHELTSVKTSVKHDTPITYFR